MVGRTGDIGDWFLVPQHVELVASHYPSHVPHRWIVVGADFGGERAAVLRSTKNYSEIGHRRHPAAHEENCQVDEDGYLVPGRRFLAGHQLEASTYSCHEPDDAVLETAMGLILPPKTGGRRRGGRA